MKVHLKERNSDTKTTNMAIKAATLKTFFKIHFFPNRLSYHAEILH